MPADRSGTDRPAAHAMVWAWRLALATAVFDAALMLAYGFSVPPRAVALTGSCAAGIFGISWFYRRVRPDEILAALAETASFLIAFTSLLAVMSYLVVTPAWPLLDSRFAAFDAAFGFDWREHLYFVASRPWLSTWFERVYETSIPQIALACVGLALTRDLARLRMFTLLFAVTGIAAVVLSGLLPAAGAYAYFQPEQAVMDAMSNPEVGHWHLKHLNGLRDGSLRTIPLPFVEGLITFPSFHAALAVITAWALLGLPVIGWCGLLLNGAVICSALTMGGHYLADIAGGCAISAAAIAVLTRRRAYAPERIKLTEAAA